MVWKWITRHGVPTTHCGMENQTNIIFSIKVGGRFENFRPKFV